MLWEGIHSPGHGGPSQEGTYNSGHGAPRLGRDTQPHTRGGIPGRGDTSLGTDTAPSTGRGTQLQGGPTAPDTSGKGGAAWDREIPSPEGIPGSGRQDGPSALTITGHADQQALLEAALLAAVAVDADDRAILVLEALLVLDVLLDAAAEEALRGEREESLGVPAV